MIDQRSTYVPIRLAVAVEDPEEASLKVTVPGPETLVQLPLPVTGVFPPKDSLTSVEQ